MTIDGQSTQLLLDELPDSDGEGAGVEHEVASEARLADAEDGGSRHAG